MTVVITNTNPNTHNVATHQPVLACCISALGQCVKTELADLEAVAVEVDEVGLEDRADQKQVLL
eukprot:CAMPEP_0175043576 /NCGR_PEP_ID=MMETSP0052_2-20121109/3274_1 /TAXON_ID=51329 ORGANISM="Polytomella parva, Strain SAG 63-3" /NCGR_SAMPLE_ID=MMETSP0052_2 /ASSEMBLY_ACC=CAM_ASM_000194 /LENGTH=63 /DNA_ID=CAMNT_0016306671 /DNA_START=115 /DNA_END=306 /DNA_ORIENTATION=-